MLSVEAPDAVIVQGDTNSTLAGALAASKLRLWTVHIEAGCRSFNRDMPEELNRIVADHLADCLLAPNDQARDNLLCEGIDPRRIYVAGSTSIDACLRSYEYARELGLAGELGLVPGQYVALTIHRAENASPEALPGIVAAINELAASWPFVFPMHPRTRAALGGKHPFSANVRVLEPLGHLETLSLLSQARAVITDSGGLQEEAATLGVPLLIARWETEWAYLVNGGAAFLIGNTRDSIVARATPLLRARRNAFRPVDVSGQRGAAQRITGIILDHASRA